VKRPFATSNRGRAAQLQSVREAQSLNPCQALTLQMPLPVAEPSVVKSRPGLGPLAPERVPRSATFRQYRRVIGGVMASLEGAAQREHDPVRPGPRWTPCWGCASSLVRLLRRMLSPQGLASGAHAWGRSIGRRRVRPKCGTGAARREGRVSLPASEQIAIGGQWHPARGRDVRGGFRVDSGPFRKLSDGAASWVG